MTNLVWAVGEGLISPHSHILWPCFFNLDSIKARSPAEGSAYLPDFTEHVLLAWELKPHLEAGLSQGEMEVTPEATDGASRESQAGKGDSPRTVQFLRLFLSHTVNQGTIQSDKMWFKKY